MAGAQRGMCELMQHGMGAAWAQHGMSELALTGAFFHPPLHQQKHSSATAVSYNAA
jgi:hypothetical protein